MTAPGDGAAALRQRALTAVASTKRSPKAEAAANAGKVKPRIARSKPPAIPDESTDPSALKARIEYLEQALAEAEQTRRKELNESLEYRTATADVLKAISRSSSELQPVLDSIVTTAARLCRAEMAAILKCVGDKCHVVATKGMDAKHAAYLSTHPVGIDRGTVSGRAILERRTLYVPDILADPEFNQLEWQRVGKQRSALAVPLLREGLPIGVIALMRTEISRFADRDIELVTTFADQAVIAIENARLFEAEQTRTRELRESLEIQTATADILRVIASSPNDLGPVLEAVAESAARLCDASDAAVFLPRDGKLLPAAHHGPIQLTTMYAPIGRDWISGRSFVDRKPVQCDDLSIAGGEFPRGQEMALRDGHRTVLATPLLREGEAIGVLCIRRTEVRPFTDKQIALLQTFADQAVIAIENARLFEAEQTRTKELQASLEFQTGTSDVLSVISRSPAKVQPVLDAIVQTAQRLCESDYALIMKRADGGSYRLAASCNASAQLLQYLEENPVNADDGSTVGMVLADKKTLHLPDILAEPRFTHHERRRKANARSVLGVPLMRTGEVIGVVFLARHEVAPFTDRQIDLVTTFADQAVIAIENARLFEAEQTRTKELKESLEYQTAISEVLAVISRSPNDLQPVIDTIAATARRLCEADEGLIYQADDDVFRMKAHDGVAPDLVEQFVANPILWDRGSATGRAVAEKRTIHIEDFRRDPEFTYVTQRYAGGSATLMAVPLMRHGDAIGTIALARHSVRPFSDRQIALVETFADQAVIAIENARLFEAEQTRTKELQESLKQQTATADVLKAISRSAFDLQKVLDTLIESATILCGADMGMLRRRDGDTYPLAATHGMKPEWHDRVAQHPNTPGRQSILTRATLEGRTVQSPDVVADPEFVNTETQKLIGFRAVLATPIMREGRVIGTLGFYRFTPGSFGDRQIELIETFADQAVIAIENARLFEAEQTRSKELKESLEYQTAIVEVLAVISKSPNELQPVFDTIAQTARRLCEAERAAIHRPMSDGIFRGITSDGPAPYDADPSVLEVPAPVGRASMVGRVAGECRVVQILNVQDDPDYEYLSRDVTNDRRRTMLGVPLVHKGTVVGIITLTRTEVRAFTERQINLVTTFADQAVIAIENARLFEAEQTRTKELAASLAQQTATADVLKAISRSAFDLQKVLDTLVEAAARLCGAERGLIRRRDGDVYLLASTFGFSEEFHRLVSAEPIVPGRGSIAGRVIQDRATVHVPDILADAEFDRQRWQRLGDFRSMLGVPLLREGDILGALLLHRKDAVPFTPSQIALLETFADQAVIAIENARLLDELQTRQKELESRSAELAQSLEYQTATSEVLGVISRSQSELQPVLDAILDTGARLCEADRAMVHILKSDAYVLTAARGIPDSRLAMMARIPIKSGRDSAIGRVLSDRKTVHIENVRADRELTLMPDSSDRAHTVLVVPLLRFGEPIGVLTFARVQARCFTERQVALVETFADQAVIAIENARLLDELQTRQKELTESLEYQTATSDVLGVISRSPNELQPVLDVIVTTAGRLCEADYAHCRLERDGLYHVMASHALVPDQIKEVAGKPVAVDRTSVSGRVVSECRTIHVPDVLADPENTYAVSVGLPARTILGVPLMRDGAAIGTITLFRKAVRPFTQRQIDLVTTFANQAVIAINNVGLFAEVQARTREVTEALEYQTATSDVLGVISRSPNELQPVLDVIVNTAKRLCASDRAAIWRLRDGKFDLAAHVGMAPDTVQYLRDNPIPSGSASWAGRSVLERRTMHVHDATADPRLVGQQQIIAENLRTMLMVPLLRDDQAMGVISLARTQVAPFTDRQIELVETFADQALIAINNVGLFEEVQARTKELQDSLEYQTATSEVLGVISGSPTNLQPVLDAIADTASRLCGSRDSIILLRDGENLRIGAHRGPMSLDFAHRPLNRTWVSGRCVVDQARIHIHDLQAADREFPQGAELARRFGHRTTLAVPLVRDASAIGCIFVTRYEVDPFSDRQVALLETFADQAVIAINNVRLFEEVQARTKELQESLEYQTATSEVLNVISRSPSQLQPVLDAIVETASRLCQADFAFVFKLLDGKYHLAAMNQAEAQYAKFLAEHPITPGRETLVGRVALERRTVHLPDAATDPEYTWVQSLELGRQRTMMGVPLMREGVPIGVIALARRRVQPFTDRQIELVTTFADQAMIAINNVQLFDEVQARTRELARSLDEVKALGEVGRAVSSSLDLDKILPTILEHACEISDTGGGAIYVFDEARSAFVLEAGRNMSDELIAEVRAHPIGLGDTLVGQCGARREAVQIEDLTKAPPHPLFAMHMKAGVRSLLAVPLLHQDEVVGALVVRRKRAGAFAPETVSLLQSFASQSAIAIQNARLFHEIEEKGRQLKIASQHKSQFVANMSHELRTPLAAMLGYAELLKEGIYGALPEKSAPIVTRIQSNGKHLLGLINTVLDISKIESGQFQLNLGEYALGNMVETVRVATESLAASKKLALKTEVAGKLPHGLGDEQRLTQVLLNLVGNAIKFTDTGEVCIRAGAVNGRFTVDVSDTGPGIPPEERERIFEKFHQIDNSNTRTKGGTGLGLAIAKDIVELHGGRIWVESTVGRGSTFRMELPVRAAAAGGEP